MGGVPLPTTLAPQARKRPAPAWHLPLLLLAPVAVYANALSVPFVLDDDTSIVTNPGLATWAASPVESASRRIAYLSFKLNYALGGLDPFGYHVVNVAIHVLTGLAVYALIRRLLSLGSAEAGDDARGDAAALAGALLFALHPVQTQAVTYVVQRIASLATMFYATAMLLYTVGRTTRSGRVRLASLLGALVAAAAAMRTKEISFTLPFAILLLEFSFFPASRRRRAALALASCLLLAIIPLTYASRGLTMTSTTLAGSQASRLEYAATQPGVVVRYLAMLAWPVGQNIDHDVPLERDFRSPKVILPLGLLLALAAGSAALLLRARRHGLRLAGAGGLLFFLGLSVESSIIPIADVMFEHRLYLPMVGVAVGVAGALHAAAGSGPRAARRLAIATGVWLAALGAATVARNHVWRDPVTLWSDAAEKSPGKARPHFNLGEALRARGDLAGASRAWSRAIEIDPSHSYAANQLGSVELMRGDLAAAERWYRRAAAGTPVNAEAYYNLALVLDSSGRPGEAMEYYRRFVAKAPSHLGAEVARVRERFGWR